MAQTSPAKPRVAYVDEEDVDTGRGTETFVLGSPSASITQLIPDKGEFIGQVYALRST